MTVDKQYAHTVARRFEFYHDFQISQSTLKDAVVGHVHKNDVFLRCEAPFSAGSNVVSAAYDLRERTAYVAWEDGSGAAWRPAACNTYIQLDLRKFFV